MRRMLLLSAWLAGDVLLFMGAYVMAYFLRVGLLDSTVFPLDRYLQTVVLVAPVWLGVMVSLRTYALPRVQASRRNILYIAYASTMGLALFALAFYFLHGEFFSRLILVYAGTLSFLAITVWHIAFDQWQRRTLRSDPPAYPLLVIGANREAERLIALLEKKQSVFRPVAVLDSRGTDRTDIGGVPVLGKLNKLEEVIKEKRITHLAQCADLEHTLNLLGVCRQKNITYFLLPSVLGIVEGDERMETLEGTQPVTMVARSGRWLRLFQ